MSAQVLGTIARVTAAKGIDDGLRAIATLRSRGIDAYYVVVGDGDALAGCRKIAVDLDISDYVRFLGYRSDVDHCLSAMDLFLFPSHKEAMGIALVEAMRAGLPVVANNVGGIPEVVSADCGVLVPDGHPELMADAAYTLLADPSRLVAMGRFAAERAQSEFSAEAMERATDAVYRHMLGQSVQVLDPVRIEVRASA